MKAVLVGSGSDGLNESDICGAVTWLTGKPASACVVLYVGTATYDLPGPRNRQTERFSEAGCKVKDLCVASSTPATDFLDKIVAEADILLVSGGNTLFAVDRWKRIGLDKFFCDAMIRGAVLTGGSAGAICWFDGGHSDSMDPETYKEAMLHPLSIDSGQDESGTAPAVGEAKPWEYIRIDGLGFLPGLCCAHHDRVQSNGILRAHDFDAMLTRHSGERGVGIDHWAALVIDGDTFRTISLPGKGGSVKDTTFCEDGSGVPGIWIKTVEQGQIRSWLAPSTGKLSELLAPAESIEKDPRVDVCRAQNPDATPFHAMEP